MTLLELQRRMSEDVRRPLTRTMDMQHETDSGHPVSALAETYVKANDRLSSFERLEIYNRQYWFRVIAAVTEDYPALNAALGQKKFDAVVLAYLKDTPSTSWTLRDLGGKLPDWLEAHPEHVSKRHRLMVDIARLELAYIDAFDKAALEPLTEDDFQHLAADSSLMLQPHLQLLQLRYPVDELVLAVHRDTPETDIVSNAVSARKQRRRTPLPKMVQSKVYLAVHRFEDSVFYRRLEREAFLILSALQAGKTAGESLARAFTGSSLSQSEQAETIQACFAHGAELGWFCREPREESFDPLISEAPDLIYRNQTRSKIRILRAVVLLECNRRSRFT